MRRWKQATCSILVLAASCRSEGPPQTRNTVEATAKREDADVIIVGAGLAGISAAIEAAQKGLRVIVLDMSSVFGGHAVRTGGISVVGSPLQEAGGFRDSPEKAYQEWIAWTVDGDPEWLRFYAENSRTMVYDWVTSFGVSFDRVVDGFGDTAIPRYHLTHRGGLNLARPLFLEAMRYSNIDWRWNVAAEHLIQEEGRIAGVRGRNLRTDEAVELRAPAVILATGGFQCNTKMVIEHWPKDLPKPARVWATSGQYSRGSGLIMAAEVGAALVNLDRQHNTYSVAPNVLGLDEDRGFPIAVDRSIFVNSDGKRFVTEQGLNHTVYAIAMKQQPKGHWMIFDHAASNDLFAGGHEFMSVEGPDWAKMKRWFTDNPKVTDKAETIDALAQKIGVSPAALSETIKTFNEKAKKKESQDVAGVPPLSPPPSFTIEKAPFYAIKLYPGALKSGGGISVDRQTRALDTHKKPVRGLYAAGEVTGSAGMNGQNVVDGMYTGPAILMGRIAARTVAQDLEAEKTWTPIKYSRAADAKTTTPAPAEEWKPNLGPTELKALLESKLPSGYWHFERVHHLVLERKYECTQCHSALLPFATVTSTQARVAQARVCDSCHLAKARPPKK